MDHDDRAAYLHYMDVAAGKWDWRILSYVLMSSHVHHGAVAGLIEPRAFFHSVHRNFAAHFHRRHGGLGPVVAHRPKNYEVAPARLARMVAYHHRNPVDAGCCADPSESRWSSHRFYLRLEQPPSWLDVEWALSVIGFDDTESGRRAFADYVRDVDLKSYEPGNLGGGEIFGDPVGSVYHPPLSERQWHDLLVACARVSGLTPVSVVESRERVARDARRLFAQIARREFQQTYAAIGNVLRVSTTAAHRYVNVRPVRGTASDLQATCERIADDLRRAWSSARRSAG